MARQTCRGLLAVQLKDVPARTCTANLLKLRLQFFQSCLLVSIHRLVIRSSLAPMKGVRLSLMRLPSTPRRPIPESRRSSGGLPAGFTRGFFDDEWSAAPPSLRRSLRIAERPKSRLDDRHSLGRTDQVGRILMLRLPGRRMFKGLARSPHPTKQVWRVLQV